VLICSLTKASAVENQNYATKEEEALIKKGYVFFPPKTIRPIQDIQIGTSKDLSLLSEKKINTTSTAHVEEKSINGIIINQSVDEKKLVTIEPIKINEDKQGFKERTAALYTSIGTESTFGLTKRVGDEYGVRFDYSQLNEKSGYINNNNSQYVSAHNGKRVGAYIDWWPSNGQLRLTAGVSYNQISYKLITNSLSQINLNKKSISLNASDDFSVRYTFPEVSPYFGIGMDFEDKNNFGWSGFSELGVNLGKPNANVSTTLIGRNGITAADVTEETNSIGKSIYKWDLILKVSVGLIYRY